MTESLYNYTGNIMTMTVNDSENEKLEPKASINLNEIAETVCAFSNNVGGKF